ncbi:MAG: NAD+ synthase [Elusimicrobia bacterium CG1_02_63_36]|nr:MAG: NAD+ synthase [Elusimicrobia bacterium CG1_02_63_36]
MRIALAQLNSTVGDIAGNTAKIKAAYDRAVEMKVDLLVTPELSLCGYPPRDLLEQPDFIDAMEAAVADLAQYTGAVGLLVGCAERRKAKFGRKLHNAAVLLHNKKVVARRRKTLLPTYDVFDEDRYFEPETENKPVRFKGKRLGITICEDAWNDGHFWPAPRYNVDPVRSLVQQGAEILINMSASPYEAGKIGLRQKMLQAHAQKLKRPLLYCAAVGGNDELIFDGNSFAIDAKGGLVLRAKGFEEDFVVVDPNAEVPSAKWEDRDPSEELYHALVLGIRDYAGKCGFKDALIGLSGGIDSAVTCVLAADALGAEHVTGVAMPSMYSSPGSVADATALAANLGVRLYQISITGAYTALLRSLDEVFRDTEPGVAEQNLQARIRGTLLMAISNKTGGLLLSTGNKSEMAVGYCTLYGDMNGGLAVIGDVLKTKVYELARWINRETERIPAASITKAPSAELRPDQTDQDDLPSYEQLDAILRAYVEEGQDAASIAKSVKDKEWVFGLLDRVDRNEYKRRQAPPILRVSPKAFGTGRRIPMARGSHRKSA